MKNLQRAYVELRLRTFEEIMKILQRTYKQHIFIYIFTFFQ